MKKGQYFMNDKTGVITNIHREAVGWYAVGVIDKKRRKWK